MWAAEGLARRLGDASVAPSPVNKRGAYDTTQATKDRITRVLKKHLELAQEQLEMAERGILLSIDAAPEWIDLTKQAPAIRLEQLQGALDRDPGRG